MIAYFSGRPVLIAVPHCAVCRLWEWINLNYGTCIHVRDRCYGRHGTQHDFARIRATPCFCDGGIADDDCPVHGIPF